MSNILRRLAKRRDRRKAKQSGWRRPGRSNPRKVGHGGGGQVMKGNGKVHLHVEPKEEPQLELDFQAPVLELSLEEIAKIYPGKR